MEADLVQTWIAVILADLKSSLEHHLLILPTHALDLTMENATDLVTGEQPLPNTKRVQVATLTQPVVWLEQTLEVLGLHLVQTHVPHSYA